MTQAITSATLTYWVTAFVLVVARVSTFFVVFPLFRAARVPRLIKVSFSIALSGLWLSSMANDAAVAFPIISNDHWVTYGVAIAREMIIGGALGYLFGLFFLPAEIAGSYLGQEMGLSMASITDPSSGTSTNVLGELLGVFAMLIFFGSDVHHFVIGTLYSSFANIPVGEPLRMFQIVLRRHHRNGDGSGLVRNGRRDRRKGHPFARWRRPLLVAVRWRFGNRRLAPVLA